MKEALPWQRCGIWSRRMLKRYLERQAPAKTPAELQVYSARLKARPADAQTPDTHFRVRHDKVDSVGRSACATTQGSTT